MANRFWVGGTGNSNVTTSWSTTSGGASGASVPTTADAAIFDANSFSANGQTVTIPTGDGGFWVQDADFSAINKTINVVIANTSGGFSVGRNFTLPATGITWSGAGVIKILYSGGGGTFTTNGALLGVGVTFANFGGFNSESKTVTGTLNAPGQFILMQDLNVTTGNIIAATLQIQDGNVSPTWNPGSSTVTLTSTFQTFASSPVINASSATIAFTGSGAKTFNGGGKSYGTVSNTGSGILTIGGSNTIGTLDLDQNSSTKFTSGTTQTVTSIPSRGTAGNPVTVQSVTAASPFTLSKSSGVVSVGNWSIKDSTASGGATFYAGSTSTNVSGNTGWLFSDPTVDITKTAQYSVASNPTDITKSALYVVSAPHDITKTAQYQVSNLAPDITKTATYRVASTATDITKTATYRVASPAADITKSATYVTDAIPVQEDLDSITLRTLKIGKAYGPVTSVILGRVPQNDNIIIASTVPQSNLVTAINTSTNLFTIVGHGMADGNLVQIQSTGTIPSPLQPNTNYFVFTNGSPDNFYLTPTYIDAFNGSALIDLTDAGSGTITLTHLQTQEVQINNNQIVDDDRQTLLPEIYGQLVGLNWSEVKADTIGLPWHEVGDIIKFTQGSTTVNGFISEMHLVLAGSVQEQLVSVVPDVATINYQTAGGILKTIHNTEIKVDKQNNEITSIVEEQDVFATETQTNFTEIYQNIAEIVLSVQKSGGANLLLNSVGFATESALDNDNTNYTKLSFWDYNPSYDTATHGTAISYSSSDSQNNGGVSGQVIELIGNSIYLKQRINVAVGAPLSFGMLVKNTLLGGDVTVSFTNAIDNYTISVDDSSAHDWDQYQLENFTSSMNYLDVKIAATTPLTRFQFTDLRLMYGTTLQPWMQASSEILATNVQFTKNGMKIFDNLHETETQVTYNEFSTRRKSDNLVLFEADDSGVITNDLTIKGGTNYYDNQGPIIKQITIPRTSNLGGVAFIRVVS